MIHAGELKHLARFSVPTVATTGGDTTLDPHVESFEAWISIQPIGMVESEVGDALQGARMSLVKMRYDSRINRQLRMRARSRDFEIVSVLNIDEQDTELSLQVRELA